MLLLDDPGSSAVVVSALSAAGWRHDPAGRAGIAHLGEHLLAVGGGPRTRGIEAVGGRLDATTHADHLQFVLRAPVEFWCECVHDQLARLGGSFVVSEDEFDYQRRAVVEEIRALSASASPWPAMTKALFDDPALGHEGFGVEADLDGMNLDWCGRFVRGTVGSAAGILVCALDLAAIGGASVLIEEVEARTDRALGAPAPEAELPIVEHRGTPRTVAGTGVEHRWFGWSIPGLRRDRTQHTLAYALWSVLRSRSVGSRFGRSGFGHVADRETVALAVDGPDIGDVTGVPISADDVTAARDSLLRISLRTSADPTALGRAVLLGGGIDLADSVRRIANNLTNETLDATRRHIHDVAAAVVTPSNMSVDTGARFSRDQAPGRQKTAALPTKEKLLGLGGGRHTVMRGRFTVAVRRDGPLHVRIRTAAALDQRAGAWHRVPDLGGHRYETAVADCADAVSAIESAGAVTELVAAGADAHSVVTAVAVSGPRYDPGPALNLADAAAQWLALGALNGIHAVARGEAPTVTLLRLVEPSGPRFVVVDTDTDIASLHDAVRQWTPRDVAAARTFCQGQAAVASGSPADSSDLLLTLLSIGTGIGDAESDVVAAFAAALADVDDETVRATAHELTARASMTNVRASA